MSKLKSFVYFSVLVDKDEIDALGRYDRNLIFASFMRQMLGAIFAFLVFFYAGSTLMPLWLSCVIAVVLSSIVFFMDQAIVGSEWSVRREISGNPLNKGLSSFLQRVARLFPRIVFAVAIAWFMATLAEIALQSRAIDRVLKSETREANQEYFQRTDELKKRQQQKTDELDSKIRLLEAGISAGSAPNTQQTVSALDGDIQRATSTIDSLSASIAKLTREQEERRRAVTSLRASVTRLNENIASTERLMDAEVNDPNRCRAPGNALCKGERWAALKEKLIAYVNRRGEQNAQLTAAVQLVGDTSADLSAAESRIEKARLRVADATSQLAKVRPSEKSLSELESELAELLALKTGLQMAQAIETTQLEERLQKGGFRAIANYGPLDRRLGLQRLHNDPELGPAARQFSMELKIVVILFELSPVLVAVFFAPFSFFSLQMQEKRSAAETAASSKLATRRREAEIRDAKEQASHNDELAEIEKREIARNAELAVLRRETTAEERKESAYFDSDELQKIQAEIEVEERRSELLRKQRMNSMLERGADGIDQENQNGA